MANLTEAEIMQAVYSDYEGDIDDWEATSEEYLAARRYGNKAINKWEFYDNTKWRDLWGWLEDAADGDKVTTTSSDYNCPTNFRAPGGYVLLNDTVYHVYTPEKVSSLVSESSGNWCYFTGNIKDGFDLHFNPNLTITAGQTINYPYYKSATKFTTTTSQTEMQDPYMIEAYILYRLYLNDGELELAKEARDEWKEKLESMRTANMSGIFGVQDVIEETLSENDGMGL